MGPISCFCVSLSVAQQHNPVILRGTLVTPGEVVQDGFVTVSGNKITETGSFSGHPPSGVIDTDSLVFPGLIDLHDPITWNFLPRWKAGKLFNNRYDWQQRRKAIRQRVTNLDSQVPHCLRPSWPTGEQPSCGVS